MSWTMLAAPHRGRWTKTRLPHFLQLRPRASFRALVVPAPRDKVTEDKLFQLWHPQTQVRASHLLVKSGAFDLTPLSLFPNRKIGGVIPLNLSLLIGKMGIFIPPELHLPSGKKIP